MRARLFPPEVRPTTQAGVAMAPALIIGLSGRPVPGSRLMELNASPWARRRALRMTARRDLPARARRRTAAEIDWMVKWCGCPPHPRRRGRPGGDADAEPGRVGLGQLGDVVGDAAVEKPAYRACNSCRCALDREGAGMLEGRGKHVASGRGRATCSSSNTRARSAGLAGGVEVAGTGGSEHRAGARRQNQVGLVRPRSTRQVSPPPPRARRKPAAA